MTGVDVLAMKDTYKAALVKIADRFVAEGLLQKDCLADVRDGYIHCLDSDRHHVTVCINSHSFYQSDVTDRYAKDEKGNEYAKVGITFHLQNIYVGAVGAKKILAYVEFLGKVGKVAAELEEELGDLWKLTRRAKDAARREAKAAIQQHKQTTETLLAKHTKGFRVGAECTITLEPYESLAAGKYPILLRSKTYLIDVHGDRTATISRTG